MKKKVLVLIPNLKGGGAERVVTNLVNLYKSNNYELTLMTLFDVGSNKELINTNVRYRYFLKNQVRGIWRIFKLIPAKLLHKIIIKEKYDIEIAYLEGMATKIVSGGCENVKKITWIHCELTNHEKYFLEMYRNSNEFRRVYSLFDKIVCVSNDVKISFTSSLLKDFSNIYVVHNVLDEKRIFQLSMKRNKIEIDENKINFVSVGRLVNQKGYKRLLSIFYDFKERKDIHLYILGEGPDYKYLSKYLYENSIKNVTLLGFINNPYSFIKKMDCFICASFQEGFSTSVAEALILGVPVISTKCSGSEELCSEGAGIVCDNNSEGLKKAIISYLNCIELQKKMKENAKKKKNGICSLKALSEFESILNSCYDISFSKDRII